MTFFVPLLLLGSSPYVFDKLQTNSSRSFFTFHLQGVCDLRSYSWGDSILAVAGKYGYNVGFG